MCKQGRKKRTKNDERKVKRKDKGRKKRRDGGMIGICEIDIYFLSKFFSYSDCSYFGNINDLGDIIII